MADTTTTQPRLKTLYLETAIPALQKEFGYKNVMQVPRLEKVVVNMGVGAAGQTGGDAKLLEAQRLLARTKYDLEMMLEVGYCSGIENYSRHLDGRKSGDKP